MLERLDRDTLLMVGINLLPLLGVWLAGWDAATLLVLYWLETLVIGFWTIVLVAGARDQTIGLLSNPGQPSRPGLAVALFVLVHAGFFMAIHMFFLHFAFHVGSGSGKPLPETILAMVLDAKLWIPLAGLFVIRALVTADALRRGESVDRHLVGFYFRIVVMQLAILGGGFLLVLLGVQAVLLMLIVVRIGFELAVPSVEDYVEQIAQRRSAS
jgi:hypothetical protein